MRGGRQWAVRIMSPALNEPLSRKTAYAHRDDTAKGLTASGARFRRYAQSRLSWMRRLRRGAGSGHDMGGVKASVKAVLRRARHGSASPAVGEPCEAAGGRDRLLVEMEAAFVGTVEITTYMTQRDVRVEVHLSYSGEPGPGAEDGSGS